MVGERGFEPPTPWSRTGFWAFLKCSGVEGVWNQEVASTRFSANSVAALNSDWLSSVFKVRFDQALVFALGTSRSGLSHAGTADSICLLSVL